MDDVTRRVARLAAVCLATSVGVAALATGTGFVGVAAADAPDCSTVGYSGDGSSSNPYAVDTVDGLQCVGEKHADASDRSDALSSAYVVTSDIDASGTSSWNGNDGFDPIGSSADPFVGSFDGNGYVVSGLTVARGGTNNVGVFGYVGTGGVVTDVTFTGVDITGGDRAGGLVGRNAGGDVVETRVAGSVEGGRYTGGVVGLSGGVVRRSGSSATVSGSGNQAGGLVGENRGLVERSYATGSVSGSYDVGGLVGKNDNGDDVTFSFAAGPVSGTSTLGGLVGNNAGSVSDSYWDVDVTGNGQDSRSSGSFDAQGLGTTRMQRFAPLSNMGDFDFETTWNVTSSYPRLDWEGVPSLTVDSVSAAGTTVDEDATGTITVTASEGGTNAGEGVTIEVTNDDGLDGFATGDTKVTDTNGQVTFSFAESVDGSYTPAFAWQPDPSVSDTASVLVRDAPEVSSITRASPSNPTSASSVEFDVTFTESVSGVDTDDVVLTRINGDVAGSVATVSSSSGTTITVTVDSVVGDGDLRLDVDDDDGIVNGDGVPLGGSGTSGTADGSYTGNEVSTVDNTDPTIRTIATRDDGPAPGTTVDGTDGSAATANDGRIDQLLVTFSEPIDDSTVSSGDFAVTGYTIDAITDDGTANDDTLVFDLQESGSLDTGATPDVDYTEGALEDEAGNRLASATETPDDGVGPRIGSAETGDVNRDGTVDRVNVTFSEPIDDATLAAADFSVHGGWVDAVDNPDGTDDAFVNLSVSGLVTGDTSLTPELTLAQASVDDGDGNGGPAGADQINTPADGAPPVVVAATTDDANGDGDADRIVVTHSEALDDAASTLTTATYTTGSGTVDAVDTGATTDDDATAITVSGLTGTGVTPDVTLGSGTALDVAGNALGADRTFTGTTSGAAPIVTAATTLDRDGDGDVDAARVTFSTDMDDATITPSDWAIGGTAASTFVTGATADDDTGQLRITTDADEVSGTDPKEVTYTPGTARDTNGNALRSTAAGDVIEDDGATPVVTEFTATVQDNERIVVTVESSEQLDSVRVGVTGPETATLSSFSTSGIGPVTNNLTYESGAAGEYMLVLDEAADAAGNDGAGDETDTARIESGRSGGGPPSPAGSVTDRSGSARTLVFDDDGSATLPVSGDAVSEVTIRTTASATGYAQATELSRLPAGTASPSNRLLRTVDIQVPDEWGNTEATVELSVRRSQLDAESDRLRIEHYDESAGSWTTLETAVVRETDTTVTVGAETFGFSLFAVTAVDRPENDGAAAPEATAEAGTAPPTTQQDADAATPESTEAPDGEATGTPAGTSSPAPTEGTAPGFGPAVAVLSLVVGCLVARGAGN